MTNQPAAASTGADQQLADILARLTDDIRAGRRPDIDALQAAHADLKDELAELWRAVEFAEGIAAWKSNELTAPGGGTILHDEQSTTGPLPRKFGDFELVAALGQGGMGVVYKARQLGLDRTVALKLIRAGRLSSPQDFNRFQFEAQATARLDHPHIVPVFEVGEIDGQPYFTMKYVEGSTLAERLSAGPLPPRDAAEILAPVCHAIHYAHAQGVLHRDLKPSNILIDSSGRALVTDFGLAKAVDDDSNLTRTGAVIGTPWYMSPEQAAGQPLTAASDVYSLGAVLYEVLAGRPPFPAAAAPELLRQVREEDPLRPRLVNPRADRDLEMIALRSLQKVPGLRYASAKAMGDDLDAYLKSEPISARSGRFAQVVAGWFRETHHATVLENWGLLWMWHSLALLVLCLVTNFFQWRGVTARWPYVAVWTAGLGTWAAFFWALRRRAGPVTFVERQIAHVWAASVISIALLFLVETILGLPVLKLAPVLGIASGMIFMVKAGILTGEFYIQAAALFATSLLMAACQRLGWSIEITLFGVVSAACFFFPGLKHYRQARRRAQQAA